MPLGLLMTSSLHPCTPAPNLCCQDFNLFCLDTLGEGDRDRLQGMQVGDDTPMAYL